MNVWLAILIGWAVIALLMAGLWAVQRRTHNAGIVDIAWSFGTGLMGVWFALTADGDTARRVLVAILAGFWGVRLGIHLLNRVMREEEDGRYLALREKWGSRTQPLLFVFFQVQAAWAVMFALPMWIAADNPSMGIRWSDFAGAAVWLIAVVGESIADGQLARFRNDPSNMGKVCNIGLWRYSRHPNYFFEWLGWWSYVLIAIGGPYAPAALAGPFIMYLFLTRVTGIPPTEQRALRSRGEAYRQYQRTTNALFPGPPRRIDEAQS